MTVSPDQAQADFTTAMTGFYGDLSGPVGMKVKVLATGLELTWNPDEMFQTASTMKVPLLYEFFRQVDAGEIDPTERVTLRHTDRVPGSGIYQHQDDGLQPTLRDIAELMITVSDNWATDIIFERLGKERVTAMLQETGMTRTFLPMTIREWFCAYTELDRDDSTVTWEYLKEALKNAEPSDSNRCMVANDNNDVSTAADMVRLMETIDAGIGLSAESREDAISILKHQNFTSIIPYRLPTDSGIEPAHKTGSVRGVKNDVGIVYSPDLTYAIAFMSRDQDDVPAVVDAMSYASRWVWDYLSDLDK